MSNINFISKVKVLEQPALLKTVNAFNLAKFAELKLYVDGEVIYRECDKTPKELESFLLQHWSENDIAEAQRILKAYYMRVSRIRNTVKDILLNGSAPHFLTLTFTNDVLENTSEATRRRYVTRFLAENSPDKLYVANIDYGTNNHREHYHAVIDRLPADWPYGFFKYQPIILEAPNPNAKRFYGLSDEEKQVRIQREHEGRLSKYIAKLTNHAIKETTGSSRAIYPRAQRKQVPQITLDRETYIIKTNHQRSDSPRNVIMFEVSDSELPFDLER